MFAICFGFFWIKYNRQLQVCTVNSVVHLNWSLLSPRNGVLPRIRNLMFCVRDKFLLIERNSVQMAMTLNGCNIKWDSTTTRVVILGIMIHLIVCNFQAVCFRLADDFKRKKTSFQTRIPMSWRQRKKTKITKIKLSNETWGESGGFPWYLFLEVNFLGTKNKNGGNKNMQKLIQLEKKKSNHEKEFLVFWFFHLLFNFDKEIIKTVTICHKIEFFKRKLLLFKSPLNI